MNPDRCPPEMERGLPANLDAERTLLGAVLLESERIVEIKARLRPLDFSLTPHQRIVAAMARLETRGRIPDVVTVAEELSQRSELGAVGGVAYLASLTEGLPRRLSIVEYIRIVKDKSLLRQFIGVCSNAVTRATDQSEEAGPLIADTLVEVEKLGNASSGDDTAPVASFLLQSLENLNREYREKITPAIPSGNAWFDHKTGGGYRHGKVCLVAARPNVGKTGWAMRSVALSLKEGRRVSFFSFDADKDEILRNLVPYFVDVPNIVANRPWQQSREQNQLVNQAFAAIAELPLRVYDRDPDIDEVCWHIDRDTRDGEEVLFVGDHATKFTARNFKGRELVNEVSGRIMQRVRHKASAFVLLCQLRKVAREYANKPPMPDDIKETGNLFEDAYQCVILHRPYEEESGRLSTKDAQINLAKIKAGGATGTTTGTFNTYRLCWEAEADLFEDREYYSG